MLIIVMVNGSTLQTSGLTLAQAITAIAGLLTQWWTITDVSYGDTRVNKNNIAYMYEI